jgi:hypothetical protein
MMSAPRVGAYVLVPGDCAVSCSIGGPDGQEIEVRLGHHRTCFELVIERDALVRLVQVATRALAMPIPDDPMAAIPVVTGAPS